MSEEKAAKPGFAIQRIYLKDCSLEVPNSPKIFLTNWKPEVKVDLDVSAAPIEGEEKLHDVCLHITVTVKLETQTAFLIEVKQGGIFMLDNFAKEQIQHATHTVCPEILFPYAREAISDLVTKAGFPQLLLSPVNFEALYMQSKQKAPEQAGA